MRYGRVLSWGMKIVIGNTEGASTCPVKPSGNDTGTGLEHLPVMLPGLADGEQGIMGEEAIGLRGGERCVCLERMRSSVAGQRCNTM